MAQTLYLTAAEITMWKKLPADLTKYWTPEEETLTFKDTDEKRAVRWKNAKLSAPAFKGLYEKAATVNTKAGAHDLIDSVVTDNLATDDMLELCFAAGPNVVGEILWRLISAAGTSHACEEIAALSTVRHGLLLSQQSTFTS